MNKMRTMFVVTLSVLFGGVALSAIAAPPEKKAEAKKDEAKKAEAKPLCPIMDEAVDFTVKTMTKDGPVYFCCAGCIKKFEKDAPKYAKKTAAQRAALAKLPRVQVTCPISGDPIDKDAKLEMDGETVYFCCNDCVKGYKAKAAKYKGKLAASYTYQAICPVMGKEIDPNQFVKTKSGEKVYFCCKRCVAKFEKHPGRYLPELKEQGYHYSAKDFKGGGDDEKSKPGD